MNTIQYTYCDDASTQHTSSWTGPVPDAIERGREELSADQDGEGYTYYADETDSRWRVNAEDLAELGAALLDGRSMSEIYSVWCAGTAANELTSEAQADGEYD